VVAAIALLVLVARARPDLASWIAGPQLSALLDRLPALDTRIWGAVLIVDAVVVARVRRLRRRFLRGDPGGDRTVVTLP
jgi:hypothetical protein